jgi:hypothetical protein
MNGRNRGAPTNHNAASSAPLGETALEPAGEVEVVYQEVPPVPPEGKKIHQRRPLPQTPEAPTEDADDANP